MKRLLFSLVLLAGVSSFAKSEAPRIQNYTTFNSTWNSVASTTMTCIISTYPANLHSLHIIVPGGDDSYIAFFDSKTSTTGAIQRTPWIPANSTSTWNFDVWFDTGITVNSKGVNVSTWMATYKR